MSRSRLLGSLCVVAALTPRCGGSAMKSHVTWPPLPTTGFITGRVATDADMQTGNAAFVLPGGQPVKIEIPQYAFHIGEKGAKTPGIVIQAEEAGGMKMIGMKELAGGQHLVGLYQEFELLGTQSPGHASQ